MTSTIPVDAPSTHSHGQKRLRLIPVDLQSKPKVTFMAFGSILTLAGYLLATLAGDLTAQPETDKTTVFDKLL
ncbi:hypothetical protein C6499_19190 [Candidatus Poribacteria bacterium]|nr:MAG: hypothetical protein C6499_19190 [Candidatus Poribacteria bacterium]